MKTSKKKGVKIAGEQIQIGWKGISYAAKIVAVAELVLRSEGKNFIITTEVTGGELESTIIDVVIPAGDYSKEELIAKVKNELPLAIEIILQRKEVRCLALKVAERIKL